MLKMMKETGDVKMIAADANFAVARAAVSHHLRPSQTVTHKRVVLAAAAAAQPLLLLAHCSMLVLSPLHAGMEDQNKPLSISILWLRTC